MTAVAPLCWALIPAKAPGEGKTRLAGVLDAAGRAALVDAMLRRVVESALDCDAIARVLLVGPHDHGLGSAVTLVNEGGEGLNEALIRAVSALPDRSNRLVIVAGDLPLIDARDFAMLAGIAPDSIGIAPDRHGSGTNALSIPAEAAGAFRFAFGPQSYGAHRREIARLGYGVEVMLSTGLEKDIDEPADFADAECHLQGTHQASGGEEWTRAISI